MPDSPPTLTTHCDAGPAALVALWGASMAQAALASSNHTAQLLGLIAVLIEVVVAVGLVVALLVVVGRDWRRSRKSGEQRGPLV